MRLFGKSSWLSPPFSFAVPEAETPLPDPDWTTVRGLGVAPELAAVLPLGTDPAWGLVLPLGLDPDRSASWPLGPDPAWAGVAPLGLDPDLTTVRRL